MFCPKCSQSQPSDEMRFCSRCGFPLQTVALVLKNDGQLPVETDDKSCRSIRSRVATESVILTVFSWTVALVCTFWFNASNVFEVIAKVGSLTFFILGLIGLVRFLYAFLFLKMEPAPDVGRQQAVSEATRSQLAPPRINPLSDWSLRTDTREMVSQPSVTENTTKLLDEE